MSLSYEKNSSKKHPPTYQLCVRETQITAGKKLAINQQTYNAGHNILEHFNIFVQFQFTTNKTKLDIYYSKLDIRVASRVTERLKTQGHGKLGNTISISNLGGDIAQCPLSFQEIELWQWQLKNTQKQIPNFSFPVQAYRISPFVSNILSGIVDTKNHYGKRKKLTSKIQSFSLHLAEIIHNLDLQCDFKPLAMFICYRNYFAFLLLNTK